MRLRSATEPAGHWPARAHTEYASPDAAVQRPIAGHVIGIVVGADVTGCFVGTNVGGPVGTFVGCKVGRRVGTNVGDVVGRRVGCAVGALVGTRLGCLVGSRVGSAVGTAVGRLVGRFVGTRVGTRVGWRVGTRVGTRVGIRVGRRGEFVPRVSSNSIVETGPGVGGAHVQRGLAPICDACAHSSVPSAGQSHAICSVCATTFVAFAMTRIQTCCPNTTLRVVLPAPPAKQFVVVVFESHTSWSSSATVVAVPVIDTRSDPEHVA